MKLIPQVFDLKEEEEDEERNLFYVCLTRAKKQVFITNYKTNSDGKSILESSFINEIKDEFRVLEEVDMEESFKKDRVNLIQSKEKKANIKDKELIKEIFTQNGLSVTAFNNYLECP